MGVDWVRGSGAHAQHLTYGLEHGLYDQGEVDNAQTKFRQNSARSALQTVESMGVDWVRGSGAHAQHLTYGLEHGLFSQDQVDAAQAKYTASRRK
jgi:hypothetical protein